MKNEMLDMLNRQMNLEYESAYIYRAMASWCNLNNHEGAAHWLDLQVREEITHAEMFRQYLEEKGYEVTFTGMKEVTLKFKTLLDVFKEALKHEQFITKNIHEEYKFAQDHDDFQAKVFLDWFVKEQIEEEANASDIVGKLELIDGNTGALFMYNQVLASRVAEHAPAK